MAFIYDNLIASVISMTVFLILVTIQADATQSNTARTSRNIAKTQADDFITWLEEDLAEMGKNMQGGGVVYDAPEDSSQWHTTRFIFSFKKYVGNDTLIVKTRYELKQTGTRTVEGEDQKIFRVDRSHSTDGSWSSSGQSPNSLGYFELEMLDEDADSTGSPSRVEFVRVKFSLIAPFQGESTFLRRVHRSTVVPYRLARK